MRILPISGWGMPSPCRPMPPLPNPSSSFPPAEPLRPFPAGWPLFFAGRAKTEVRPATYFTDAVTGKRVRIQHTTAFIREPIAFGPLPAVLQKLSRNFQDQVPIEIYAGSDGSDAIAAALVLLDALGPERAARFPIVVSDLYPQNFTRSRHGLVGFPRFKPEEPAWKGMEALWDRAAAFSEGWMTGTLSDYVDPTPVTARGLAHLTFKDKFDAGDAVFFKTLWSRALDGESLFRLRPEVRRHIQSVVRFRRKPVDVVDAMARKPASDRPRVVMIRNVVYLIPPERRALLVERLGRNLPVGSLLVVGQSEYDTHPYAPFAPREFQAALEKAGFESQGSPFHYFKVR